MGGRSYYTLVASLPALPRFERARSLPINRERLERRLRMLSEEDTAAVEAALRFLDWQRQPIGRSDAEIVARYARLLATVTDPTLREIMTFRMNMRTVLAALRRRRQGRGAPAAGERWGVEPFARAIEGRWNEPEFGLVPVFPWLPEARRRLEGGDAYGLELLLMRLLWDHLSRLEAGQFFTFGAVLVYLFKWDVVRRWLALGERAARERFEHLVAENLDDPTRLFA